MSRSKRHSPVITDQQFAHNAWRMKRLASKAARRADLPNGGAYKKVFGSWYICDFKCSGWHSRGYIYPDARRWYAK